MLDLVMVLKTDSEPMSRSYRHPDWTALGAGSSWPLGETKQSLEDKLEVQKKLVKQMKEKAQSWSLSPLWQFSLPWSLSPLWQFSLPWWIGCYKNETEGICVKVFKKVTSSSKHWHFLNGNFSSKCVSALKFICHSIRYFVTVGTLSKHHSSLC
jgi:hypothetical protein